MKPTIKGLGPEGKKLDLVVPPHMPLEIDFKEFKVYLSAEGVVLILPPKAAEQIQVGVENGKSRFMWALAAKDTDVFKRLNAEARKYIPEDV